MANPNSTDGNLDSIDADRIQSLVGTLAEMFKYAQLGRRKELDELNTRYERSVGYTMTLTELEAQLERCRTSCVMSCSPMMPARRKEFLADARESLESLCQLYPAKQGK
jgi:hypothetical protein